MTLWPSYLHTKRKAKFTTFAGSGGEFAGERLKHILLARARL
jgi:hypothetical protein